MGIVNDDNISVSAVAVVAVVFNALEGEKP